jgi:hypothetical protein
LYKPAVSERLIHLGAPIGGVNFDAKVMTVVIYGNELRFTGERDKAVLGETQGPLAERWFGVCKQKGSDYIGGMLTIMRHKTGQIDVSVSLVTAQGAKEFSTGTEGSDAGQRRIVVETRTGSSQKARSTPLPKCV